MCHSDWHQVTGATKHPMPEVPGHEGAGVVEAVDPKYAEEEKIKKLIDEENADRRELYKLIAEKEKTTEDKVAERNAARNFQKARSGEYLKGRDGKWKRKK